MEKGIRAAFLLLLCLLLAGCGAGGGETAAGETAAEEEETFDEELLSQWVVGGVTFMVPTSSRPQNMTEDGVEYCAFQAADLYILMSAVPQEGIFSLTDFEKEEADAYLEELKAEDEYGYAPAVAELIIAGDIPYYLLGYSYEDAGSWVILHTILEGRAYNICGWRPGDRITEEDIEFLWGTASTLEPIPLETEGGVEE